MRGFLGLLKLVVIGVALVAGARAVYRQRDKLWGGWKAVGGAEGLKAYTDDLSVGKLLGSIGSLRELVGQAKHVKQAMHLR